ncbi:hypothetical protein C2I18_05690 [Paenibacillus sp. PK3_47]|uniref:GGDEF domain-containing protein n=1 Tax=Paenibacillus sp. PK3_47 TaxID=2072642 RepID=UPI00201D6C44|nr:GGDEF domain-containing protein [Paenibacillus sp. PK3_47]UQZ33095.1 hypothetical protein C2I18_05690 [Paenibacillus sp. PK3_47]
MTLLICLFFGNLLTAVLILAYRSRYLKDGTYWLFLTARLLQLWILGLQMLQIQINAGYIFPLIILAGFAWGAVEALALLKVVGLYSARIKKYYGLFAAVSASVLLAVYLLGWKDSSQLFIWTLLACILFIAYPAYVLSIKLRETPLQKLMGLMYITVIAAAAGRALAELSLPVLEGAVAAFLADFFAVGMYLLMFLGNAGFMLLSREQNYAELERVATYDELTGVLNRRAFVLRARPLIAAAAREGVPFSFLLLDVDHFKHVNDTFGHDTGDKVLRDFARNIESCLSSGDLFGRFGGEEFAVLLHRAGEADSSGIAERLRLSVQNSVIDEAPLPYTVSIGIITIQPDERLPLDMLYKLSDTALYAAKQQGRNCVVRYDGSKTGV